MQDRSPFTVRRSPGFGTPSCSCSFAVRRLTRAWCQIQVNSELCVLCASVVNPSPRRTRLATMAGAGNVSSGEAAAKDSLGRSQAQP